MSVLPGPSHLEANVPPTVGKARMKMRLLGDVRGDRVLCFLVHGDAAFTGQVRVPRAPECGSGVGVASVGR